MFDQNLFLRLKGRYICCPRGVDKNDDLDKFSILHFICSNIFVNLCTYHRYTKNISGIMINDLGQQNFGRPAQLSTRGLDHTCF